MFCHYCGKQIKDNISFCPHCGKNVAKPTTSSIIHAKDNDSPKWMSTKSRTKLTSKKHHRFRKILLWLVLFSFIIIGAIYSLLRFDIINISFLSDFNKDNILETLNERAVAVEETDIVMETDTEGTATVTVKMPNYELLFKEAYASENPDQYLVKALALGDYEIREYEEVATVTVADDVTTIHSDEVVHKLLEEALIDAINALSEVE